MSYQSELQLENDLVVQLETQGWKRIVLGGTADLETNFRQQFENLNRRALKGVPLTDNEWRTVLSYVKSHGVFDSARILRDDQVLTRDDNTTLNYSLFNKKEWCKNRFQVAQQVKSSGDSRATRYDVTLLINGLPLIQIELKRKGVEIAKAFNQIQRYKEDNAYKGLFSFIQYFVISDGVYTRYFANAEKTLNYAFALKWTDSSNCEYPSLSDFARNFLDTCWSAKMIARYMVVQEADKRLIVMRPYQVYGAEKMVACAVETGNNGFIWHTTGSGKTLTSFKVSQLIAEHGKFEKVFFLVDRRDLNDQTVSEFEKYQAGSISDSKTTRELVKNIASTHRDKRLILTTIQKFAKALKNDQYKTTMDSLQDEKVAFVVDECHRTQFGEMQDRIRSHFPNAQHFGFTGTPIFSANRSGVMGKITSSVFGECLHTYLLKDGIADNNTLPFSMEYVSTFNVKDEIADPDWEVKGILTRELWRHEDRIRNIVEDIIVDRKRKSRMRKFNAMLTVDSVHAVTLYMKAFKTAMSGLEESEQLSVATVYSTDENTSSEDGQVRPHKALKHYIDEYNAMFGCNFDITDVSRYNSDVTTRFKAGKIDILVVVNMMLTGFDSRNLNTLYVDRNLENHGLIQAYSRTNRVAGASKQVGHVRCFRNLKDKTDEAVRLFSNVENASEVLSMPYEEEKAVFVEAVSSFLEKYPDPNALNQIESEEEKADFIIAFRDFSRTLRKIETFSEFDYADFELDEEDIATYRSHYVHMKPPHDEERASILDDIDFEMDLVLSNTINVDYIYQLLASLDVKDKGSVKKVRDMVQKGGTDKLRKKSDLLLDFIDSVVPQLTEESDVVDEYDKFVDDRVQKEIVDQSSDFGISPDTLLRILSTYRFRGKFDGALYDKETTLGFRQRLGKRKTLKSLVLSLAESYEKEE